MSAHRWIVLAALGIAAPARADTAVGIGATSQLDRFGAGGGVAATVGARLAGVGPASGWWHVTAGLARAYRSEDQSTWGELRVGPQFWRCAGRACVGLATEVGFAHLVETTNHNGDTSYERALAEARAMVAVGFDRRARTALVLDLGMRGAIDLTWSADWDRDPPARRTDLGVVAGLGLRVTR